MQSCRVSLPPIAGTVTRGQWVIVLGNLADPGHHVGKEEYLVGTTLAALERELDPTRFARVHRSTIGRVAPRRSNADVGRLLR